MVGCQRCTLNSGKPQISMENRHGQVPLRLTWSGKVMSQTHRLYKSYISATNQKIETLNRSFRIVDPFEMKSRLVFRGILMRAVCVGTGEI